MTQEVRVLLQINLDVDAMFTKDQIEQKVIDLVKAGELQSPELDVINCGVVSVEEESEIYGTENSNS